MKHSEKQRKQMREQRRKYRRTHTTYSLSFSRGQARELERLSKQFNLTVPAYIKAVLKDAETHPGHVTHPTKEVQAVTRSIHKIGGNINQLLRHVNSSTKVRYADIKALQSYLQTIKREVDSRLSHPKDLKVILDRFLEAHPEKRTHIITYLTNDTP